MSNARHAAARQTHKKNLLDERHTPHPALSRKGRGKDPDEKYYFVMLSRVYRATTNA
jgi:hypothetical protein